ncbi:MAG: hypothetical protein GY750_10595 [Lentisphaerae bacterium]|nr:hypothetical protein [Lentisphaerota bacterium]MCP4101859.1 hypothetical protein [Lentisphaerota bacterium]
MPYFYLYVLTSRSKSYGNRPVYSFYYPKEAKVFSKTYDEAKIMEKVNEIDRPNIWNDNFKSHLGRGRSKTFSPLGGRLISIPLKGIKDKNIIAYHIEAWGKKKVVATKNWVKTGYIPGKTWWKRY